MAYTTNQLITGAYYAAGIVSREFETVSGSQMGDGLVWLNNIITEKSVDEGMIPYETTYNANFVIGQEIYYIPNLLQIDTLVFFLDAVRYAMKYEKRNAYFGCSRVENIQTLPFEWYFERQLGGGNLYIYFKPDQNYPMEIHGIFLQPSVALGQDLSLTLDEFYITYLRYALADRICSEFSYTTPAFVLQKLGMYQAFINKKSRILDLRISKTSTLQKRGSFNYGFVNLGHGWIVPN
ncbi:hypothetical protein UFOVP93_6 [uncultured Caudovirales phage]|uniref:Uncharacterized protein n=1 Tax=uncultured Caudovirales phage TaxID=2100421 RepID=A0A6J5KYK4_9CAUD|nr:hypothetical protein UFOVP93_6 [uncultured Caudovirales phage]